jgi:hypothetical protein
MDQIAAAGDHTTQPASVASVSCGSAHTVALLGEDTMTQDSLLRFGAFHTAALNRALRSARLQRGSIMGWW